MGRSIPSGTLVGRYRVLSLLGAGGMGEVYLARDETLQRTVALKILPPDLVKNEERVRRFIQEAKAASALSHPHIVTIHEIGEAVVESPIHFIAMELVTGSTLKQLIHAERVELRVLLGYLSQAADAIAKAHAAGVVHRDLKPENIMVTQDGYAKVLDFGLAKLIEPYRPGAATLANAATATARRTGDGVILGTVGYMSPEQVQGKPVDARSDIFSFGCILYEAATRHRPFAADSDVEILHKILKEKPPPVEELNPQAPGEVRRLIRRCLAKSPDQRLQSMKDLGIELREIADDYDSLSASASSGASGGSGSEAPVLGRRPLWRRAAVPAAILLGIAIVAVGAWTLFGNGTTTPGNAASFEAMKVTRVASIPDLMEAVLSPDGRHLAYTKNENGQWSVWIRQIATESELQLLQPQQDMLYGLALPGDGSYLYYLAEHPGALHRTTMYRVPALGGPRRKIVDDVAYDPTFAPDGRQVALIRVESSTLKSALIIASVEGNAPERTLTAAEGMEGAVSVVAWSPDGSRIAAAVFGKYGGTKFVDRIATIDVKTGTQTLIGSAAWRGISSLGWLGDGSGLVVSARDADSSTSQLWLVSYPDGRMRRITNDANSYPGATVSRDSQTICTVQTRYQTTLWSAPAHDVAGATEIDLGGKTARGYGFTVAPDGSLLFSVTERGRGAIWILDASGSTRRLGPENINTLTKILVGPGGMLFFSSLGDDDMPHIWSMKPDGTGARQLTTGTGEAAVTLGEGHVFMFRLDGPGLWRMPYAGGPPESIGQEDVDEIAYSPNTLYLAKTRLIEDRVPPRPQMEVTRVGSSAPARVLAYPDRAQFWKWMPSSDAIAYVLNEKGVNSLWRLPIDGGKPSRLLSFPRGQNGHYAFSPDGRRLFFAKGERLNSDVVLITNFR